ncbi:COG4824 Phage-related holin (Lysis protein) [uncultured Caudovirales phage]|uniref:COG4824 Phage-related holin (Lysis protein) n=1 Tax=uncultured Caudovirales phage TaxID=2100421 RepID=A0A6J5MXM8_9CAUD|nr:COG4824 Phage-related holin (Lysis protein) [uncultured Caudovirales phage]
MTTAYYIDFLAGICTKNTAVKCISAFLLIAAEFLFDGLLIQAMISLFVLVIFDYITAMLVVNKLKTPITSRKTFRTPFKMAIYFLLIAAGNISENALPTVMHFLDDTIIAFLVLTEVISVIENVGKLGYAVPNKLLNRLEEWRDEK